MSIKIAKAARAPLREQLRRVEARWWLVLLIVALTGVILMIVNTYAFYTFSGDLKAPTHYRPLLNEYLIFPYYFTFISNVTAVLVPIFELRQVFSRNSVHFQRYKIMMATNLIITLIVYWALLAREVDWTNTFSTVQTIFVHAITPVLAVAVFAIDTRFSASERKVTTLKTLALNFLMPVSWLALALSMYGILGAHGKEDVPYNFLNVAYNAWYLTVAYVLGIALAYLLFTLVFIITWQRQWTYWWLRLRSLINKKPSGDGLVH